MKKNQHIIGHKALFILSLILSFQLIQSCQKEEHFGFDTQISPQASLLGESRVFFEQQISGQRLQVMPNNPRHRAGKIPLWDQAEKVQLSIGEGLKVPLRYREPISLLIGPNQEAVSVAELSYLLVYKDQQSRYHYEVVTQVPNADYWVHRHETGRSFSGIVIVEDWWGRPIKTFKKVSAQHYILLGNPVLSTKPRAKKSDEPQNLVEAADDCDVIVTEDERHMYNVEYICHEHPGGGGQGPGLGDYGDQEPPHPHGGGGGGNHQGQPQPDHNNLDTTMTREFYQNEKAMCALNKLMQNNYYKSALNQFIGKNKPLDLNFKLEPIMEDPGEIIYGTTELEPPNWDSNKIKLTLNENRIGNMSGIEVALTLLHEGIHAEIYRKLLSIHGPNQLNNMNFPSMFNLYSQYKLSEGFSHEFIANYYIEIMCKVLRKYDDDKFSVEYYQALAWEGLHGTDVWESKPPTDKISINNKVAQLLNGRSKTNCND